MKIQEIAQAANWGMDFRQVDCDDLDDFMQNAEIGQKWWNATEELMYYKCFDSPEQENIVVFCLISGVAHQAN